jgi:hypothetical protein
LNADNDNFDNKSVANYYLNYQSKNASRNQDGANSL